MKEDLKILKEVFTRKNIIYAILFNILAYSSMYGFLYLVFANNNKLQNLKIQINFLHVFFL